MTSHSHSQTLEDVRFKTMSEKINSVLHDDTRFEKGALNMRTQRCFAIRSGMNGNRLITHFNAVLSSVVCMYVRITGIS